MKDLEELVEKQKKAKIQVQDMKSLVEDIVNNSDIDELVSVYSNANKINKIDGLINILSSLDINISVVAEVSNGKSTFLNALIFKEQVLSSGAGAVTARLFKVSYGEKYTINIDNKITSYDSLSNLKKALTVLNDDARNLINENIDSPQDNSEVAVTLPHEKLKGGITIYDTPGFGSLDEDIVYKYIKDAVSVSDAIVLLLNIAQGLKNNERNFVKDILRDIPSDKRYVVFNRYDEIISEDAKELMELDGRDINEEVLKVANEAKKELSLLAEIKENDISTYLLSSSKALLGYTTNNTEKIKDSKFDEFEQCFWQNIMSYKTNTYKDRFHRVDNLQKEIENVLLSAEDNIGHKIKQFKQLIVDCEDNHNNFSIFSEESNKKLSDIQKKSKLKLNETQNTDELYSEIEKMMCGAIYEAVESIGVFDKTKVWSLEDIYVEKIKDALEDTMQLIIPDIEEYISKVESTIKEIQSDINTVIREINIDLNKYEKYNIESLKEIDIIIENNGHIEFNVKSNLYKHVSLDSEVFVLAGGLISEVILSRVVSMGFAATGYGLIVATALAVGMKVYKNYNNPNKKLAEDVTKEIMKAFKPLFKEEGLKGINHFIENFNDDIQQIFGKYEGNISSIKRVLESPEKKYEEVENATIELEKIKEYFYILESIKQSNV